MKFLKHILTGWLAVMSVFFNALLIGFLYQVFFNPDSFYEGMLVISTIFALGIYTGYWAYCVQSFKSK